MTWIHLLGVALGLAMDAFAVSIAVGLTLAAVTARHTFRIAFHFGLFQFMMPVLGWLAGRNAAAYISEWDHWLAFGLLGLVGGKMLWESPREEIRFRKDRRGFSLVTLGGHEPDAWRSA